MTIKMAFRSIPGAKKYKMEVRSRIAEATLETPPVDPNFAASPNSTDSLSQVSTTPSNALRRASPLRALESADSTSSAAEPPNNVTVAHVGSSDVRERGALTGLAVELTNSSEPGLERQRTRGSRYASTPGAKPNSLTLVKQGWIGLASS